MINLPSVNHKPLDVKKEKLSLKKAITNYLTGAYMTQSEAKDLFKQIDNDPFVWDASDCKSLITYWMAGKQFADKRVRANAALIQYVELSRKSYF